MSSVFVPDGGSFVPTTHARAMWYDDGSLFGGPVAALLAREIDAVDAPVPMTVVRLTADLLRPVPFKPLVVETRVVRQGKRIQVVEASMSSDGIEVARASALRIRTADIPAPSHDRRDAPAPPESFERFVPETSDGGDYFHVTGVEIRVAEGDYYGLGPGAAWLRMLMPFLPGEEASPLVRAVAFADFSNGISRVLPSSEFVFLNPDLTVYLNREPVGEWIFLRARTDAGDSGYGLAQSEIFDRSGAVGHGLQSLYVDTWERFGGAPPEHRL